MSYEESTWSKVRRWMGTSFGVRGKERMMSWALAGGLAYFLFYLPEVRKAEQIKLQREYAKERAMELGIQEIDRVRPRADPQDTGLIKGIGAVRRQESLKQQQAAAAAAAEQAGQKR